MIEYIECFRPNQNFYKFSKENYYEFIDNIFPSYYYNYKSVVTWKHQGKKYNYTNKLVNHIPLKNWEGIAFLMDDYRTIIVCNPDASVKFKVTVPEKLINSNAYTNHFQLSGSNLKDLEDYSSKFKMKFERFDDYFEFEGKHYLTVKVGKYAVNNEQDGFMQMRYLNCETGSFLPFTKTISRYIKNQYSYNEETIKI